MRLSHTSSSNSVTNTVRLGQQSRASSGLSLLPTIRRDWLIMMATSFLMPKLAIGGNDRFDRQLPPEVAKNLNQLSQADNGKCLQLGPLFDYLDRIDHWDDTRPLILKQPRTGVLVGFLFQSATNNKDCTWQIQYPAARPRQ